MALAAGQAEVLPPGRPARSRERIAGWHAPLLTAALFCVGVALLLAFSPLWELPDTYCETVASPPPGGGCSAVIARRQHWIAAVLVLALVLGISVLLVRRRRDRRDATLAAAVAKGLLLLAVLLGLTAGAFLTVGRDHERCGSTLSRVDEFGRYSPDRPLLCAPSYAASRADAWAFGLLGLGVFLAATTIELRPAALRPRR